MSIDLTLPVESGMLSFPGYSAFESEVIRTYARNGHLSHEFTATTHSGTHIDAPAHYIEGATTVDALVLVTGDVDTLPPDESFFERASVLTEDAADWLVERGVSLLANDFLTEGLGDPDRPVHKTILGAGIPVVEYLCNTDEIATAGTVALTCLPLPLVGLEASPARVVAERV